MYGVILLQSKFGKGVVQLLNTVFDGIGLIGKELEGFLLQVGLRKDFRENMTRVFLLVRAKDDISYDEISTTVNLSRGTVRNHISALKDNRLLKRIGSDKTGRWQTFFPPYNIPDVR